MTFHNHGAGSLAPTKGDTMKINHTPGPWYVTGSSQDGTMICSGIKSVANWPARPDCNEATANARLIASAPEMLNALELAQATIARLDKHASATGTLDVIAATIKKAKGE